MKVYKAAIIGCGRIGSDFDKKPPKRIAFSHAGAYYLCPATELISAADSDPRKLALFKKKWGIGSLYTDYKKMFEIEDIDILSIATPADTHWPIIRYASEFPLKAIYCEKPIAQTLKDAKRIIDACRKNRILLTVNHQRRFSPFYQELKKKLTDGTLGRVQQINCYYTRGIKNTCTHIIDLFIFLFGNAEEVIADYSRNRLPSRNDPNLDATITFKSGLSVSLKACDDSNYLVLEIDILASKARIRFGETLEYFKALPGKNLLRRNELVRVAKPPFKSEYIRYGMASLTYGVKHIVNCLNKKEKPLSTGDDAIKALAIIEAMLLSAKNKKGAKRI